MSVSRIPTPDAVRYFSSRQLPRAVREAASAADRAELELGRPVSPLSVEDLGDRETVLAHWHRADKVLAATALRPEQATGVLS
ncbi:hypothetical protein [Streptomyces acidicola]|uniref:Uncharacterized protein n=1 Tax=Streptomyces acidicola TaxID=2596892 RepID=A0A5N8WL04_9ACTN|nr:hypothetical protein [Streptomyces acidicola]MPY47065.1 hypothetical protein [Streptomyces acidicola]MPY47204.1 hypothetical protein [Streptomyces acidicola]